MELAFLGMAGAAADAFCRLSRTNHIFERKELTPRKPQPIVRVLVLLLVIEYEDDDEYENEASIGIYEGAHVEPVQLRFTGWAARVAPERVWHSSQKSRLSKRDESLDMTLKVALTPELERWLWSWGDAVEVIKPVALRERLRNAHQRAAAVNR
jgi:WYL domain